MLSVIVTTLLVLGEMLPTAGFLTVHSSPPGFAVFVEGDSTGITPINRHQLEGGKYWLTVVSNDSLEALYRGLRTGSIGQRLTALWALARIDAATSQVEILPGMETRITIDQRTMEKNACRAKWLLIGGVGGVLGLGIVLGVAIGLVAN